MRKCSNCKNRAYRSLGCIDYCLDYEMATTEAEEIKSARNCKLYEKGKPDCFEDDYYSSAINGDYSPSNPWDAPGMSIRDFI